MLELIHDLLRFVLVVVTNMSAWITGGIAAAALFVYERLTKKIAARGIIVGGLIAFALASFFLAWRAEHTELKKVQLELSQPPRFNGEIESVKIGQGSDSNSAQVLIELSVRNFGSKSIVEKFTLYMHTAKDFTYHGTPKKLPKEKEYTLTPTDNTPEVVLHSQESISSEPPRVVEGGGIAKGWLRFSMDEIPDVKPAFLQQPGMEFEISFMDIAGRRYRAYYIIKKSAELDLNAPGKLQSPSPKSPRQSAVPHAQ